MPASKKISARKASKPAAPKSITRNYRDILYEVKDQVAWVTINRPRVLNAFREQTLDEMIDALKSTREDPSIVCAVVTGAGDKAFSAGGDFFAMKRLNFTNAYMWNDRMLGLARDLGFEEMPDLEVEDLKAALLYASKKLDYPVVAA